MVTTGWLSRTAVSWENILYPLCQYAVVVAEGAAARRHHREIRRQLRKHVGHDRRRHARGAAPDCRRRDRIATQHAPRVDPAALVADLADHHAAVVGAMQRMQAHARMALLDLGDDTLEAPRVV